MDRKNPQHVNQTWTTFQAVAISPGAPKIQRDEMKLAYMAGAQGVLMKLMAVFDAGREPTPEDLVVMQDVMDELQDFAAEYERTGKVPL